MARDWEATFTSWANPPGKTEQAKCDNAERAIKKAIDASEKLSKRSISTFAQGSFRNRTNVSTDSDVDVAVRCSDSFFYDLPDGTGPSDFNFTSPAAYKYSTYKDEVEAALKDYLGAEHVTRGKKAFDIHENTYRVDADAVACFEYRRYQSDGTYLSGTAFIPDGESRFIINWPEQNYENGVSKNEQTGKRFKGIVRIIKELRTDMAGSGIEIAKTIPSYLVECLVWNVPNDGFGHDTLKADVRYALAHLFNNTRTDDTCSEWGEINELKYLFRTSQGWTRQTVNQFLDKAWDYVGFE